jgi:hypothetical protein
MNLPYETVALYNKFANLGLNEKTWHMMEILL